MSQASRVVLGASFLLAVASCGGGSGSGGGSAAIEGLSAPSEVEIVTVEGAESTPSASPAVGQFPTQQTPPSFSSDSDYMTDVARNHVYDPSMEQIATVNSILCYLSQTGASEMVNLGAYNAQINEALCEDGSDPSSSSTGQSSGAALDFNLWVVDSVRASRTSPQYVSFWVPQHDQDQEATIYARVTITASPTEANPFGDFSLDFAGVSDVGGDINNPTQHGTLETLDPEGGVLGFGFFESQGDVSQPTTMSGEWAQVVAVVVAMGDDKANGQARMTKTFRYYDDFMGMDSGVQSEEFLLDFNATEVLRELVGGDTDCLSRTDFEYRTWRYNLYDATTGERVELNSGFPIRTQSGGYGWLGYYGLWTPPGDVVSNGDTVERVQYGSNDSETYTVVTTKGKLIRHERKTLLLADAEGVDFEWFDFSNPQAVRYQLNVDASQWYKVAEWDDMGGGWLPIETPEFLDTQVVGFLGLYSPTLGGPCAYQHGDSSLTYFATSIVDGASNLWANAVSGAVPLYGYLQCLASDLTGADAEAGDVYLADETNLGSPYLFEFHEDDLTLYQDTDGMGTLTRVGLADDEVPQFGPFEWGMRSGPLVLDTNGLNSVWDLWNQDEFFVYETGANPWNFLTTALDSQGDPVSFDPPVQFTYVHSTANDKNGSSDFDGFTCFFSYGGPGELHGVPYDGVDFDNDGNPDRYYPQFSIADGVLCGPTGAEYVLRAVESELTLGASSGGCVGLDTANASGLTLPDGSSYDTPDIGAKPVVNDPPAVIQGVVQ